jgi:hypothetical protein
METHLKAAGVLLILLALLHVVFPKHFHWREELARLSLLNRQVMVVHTFFIGLIVFLMGLLCLTSSAGLAGTPLGKRVALGLAVFWLVRLLVQFFGYSSELWRGKRFETAVHVVFSALWTYLTAVFAWVAW